jgi:hypothetical protein
MVNNDRKGHKITHAVEQSPPCEDNRPSVSQEIPRILWNPKVHYRVAQEPVTYPYPEPEQSNPRPISWTSVLILSSHLRIGLPSGLFPLGFPIKTLYAPILHIRAACPAQAISFLSISSPE